MNKRKDTAFTVELLGLFILLIAVITIIASVFVMSRSHSLEAKSLNEAVIIAQNTAEVASAACDDAVLQDLLKEMDNNSGHSVVTRENSGGAGSWNAFFASVKKDVSGKDGRYIVCVTRTYPDGTPDERTGKGVYAENSIEVYEAGKVPADDLGQFDPSSQGAPIYTLVSGSYFGPESYGKKGGGA